LEAKPIELGLYRPYSYKLRRNRATGNATIAMATLTMRLGYSEA